MGAQRRNRGAQGDATVAVVRPPDRRRSDRLAVPCRHRRAAERPGTVPRLELNPAGQEIDRLCRRLPGMPGGRSLLSMLAVVTVACLAVPGEAASSDTVSARHRTVHWD